MEKYHQTDLSKFFFSMFSFFLLQRLQGSVLALDDSALDVDQVDNLIKFCPTKEEMELLKAWKYLFETVVIWNYSIIFLSLKGESWIQGKICFNSSLFSYDFKLK